MPPRDLILLAPGAELADAQQALPAGSIIALPSGAWADIGDALAHLAPQWLAAEQVLLLMPGMQMDASQALALFEVQRRHGLALAQPSLSWDGYFADPCTLHNPAFVYRHTNRLDPHALAFSREGLQACLPVMGALPAAAAWARLGCSARSTCLKRPYQKSCLIMA